MSSSTKKGKAALVEFDNQTKEIRQLLNEQLKGFDARTEGKVWFLADLQEYYKRLAEVESEYARNLEKLSERFLDRLSKFRAQRKERSTNIDLWQKVLSDTKNRAKARQAFSDNVNNNIVNRLTVMSEDYQRISKKCREAGLILQDELCKSINELHRRLRKYHTLFGESKTAESKLKSTEQALLKSEESGRKNEKMNKQKEKHQLKYSENKRKSIKAKNEYVLSLQSTNKFVQTYFNKYLADLIDGFDFNYHSSFKNVTEAYASAECTFASSTIQSMDAIREAMLSVDAEVDKQQFFEDNQSTFSLPYTFNFIPSSDEETCQISPQQADVVDFHCDVFKSLKQVKTETDEINKTVEATSDALKNMYKQWDSEMSKIASGKIDASVGALSCQSIKNSSDDLELYYLSKFKELILTSSLKIRMEARNDILTRALGEVTEDTVGKSRTPYHKQLPVDTKSPQAAAILDSVQKKTKIFGCNLSEYLKITGRQIPEVVESCVRFIKKFGLDHPGIFRLSGSSTDINDMKQLFECGRDPLAGLNHWKDINAVAGLLRVYFRELEDSLFPKSHYQQFLEACMGQSSEEELIKRVSNVINTLPEEIVHVMKYMFRFLTLVSEHSENNKMDAHNLAVVFGPTLLRIPSEQDMIAYQSHVNGMLEVIIKHAEDIFPGESEPDARTLSETEDSDSDEDFEPRDAEALYDYSARSAKELSFKKGDIIRVYRRFNDDWWDGSLNDCDGFVPATYIKINDAETPDGDGCVSPTDTLPKSSSVISTGDATLQRPRDLNGPPKIPKREGSLKKRHGGPVFGERGSPIGPSPAPPAPESRSSPQTSTPLAVKQGFRITISTDDILNRQKNLRSRPKDDSVVEGQAEGTPNAETPKSSTLPRNHGSPRASAEDLSKSADEKDDVFKKDDKDESFQKRSNSLDLDRSVDESKPPVWHFRESSPGSTKTPDPPSSPRSSIGPKIPPAVKPKPKGGRPNPPSRVESGGDLLASIHAAQAARTHRTSSGGSPDEKTNEKTSDKTSDKRDSQGSVGDDTQLS